MKTYRHKHLRGKIKSLRPKTSIFKKRWFWIFALMTIILIGFFYTIFLSPIFKIKTVQIFGNEKISAEDMQTLVWKNITFKNIFMVNTKTLKKNLSAGIIGIEDIEIQKEWFNSLRLQVTERKPVAVFCQDNDNKNCYQIDKNGVIYEKTDTVNSGYFIVRPFDVSEIKNLGEMAIAKNHMEAMIKIQQNLKDNFQINVRQVFSSNPLVVTTTEGWKIYFNPEADIDLQIAKMNALLKNQISTGARKNLQYIYLQYKDRAYYK